MSSVIRLADKADHVGYDAPDDTLTRALMTAKEGTRADPDFRAGKCVVLLLDEREGKYPLKRLCNAIKTSEMIALLHVAMHQECQLMMTPMETED